jgi:hypothetical protein
MRAQIEKGCDVIFKKLSLHLAGTSIKSAMIEDKHTLPNPATP